MKYLSLLLIAFFATPNVHAQVDVAPVDTTISVTGDSLYLNIIIPETDTVSYGSWRYRVAANTNPAAQAFINGKEVKVYESGAFVDVIEDMADTTAIEFKVSLNGKTLTQTKYLVKPAPPEPINLDGKEISNRLVKPVSDRWLRTGEVLEVQFLGTPGQKVVFNIDGFKRNIPMEEIPLEEAGIQGIYRGTYEVRPGDVVDKQHITFKMKKNFFSYKKRTSEYTVSFNGLPRVAEVTDEHAYLNIGMGTDRLGGARYGELEPGVKLNVIGLKNENYKVELSSSLSAWIPVRFVELLSKYEEPVKSLTGNIRVSGQDRSDLITLSLSEKLPYVSYTELDPNRIIVDVFGATSNTNWKIKHQSSVGIKKVRWHQMEDGRFRLIIELNETQNWGYTVGYGWGAQLNIEVKRPPVISNFENPLEGRTIAVDAGHGGTNKGSLGATGALEKNVTLEITKKVKELLEEKGVHVVLTRTDDSSVYMSERKKIILENHADLLVSIHNNSIGYASNPLDVHGTGAFYKHMAYKPLAAIMYKKMRELGFNDYGLTGSFNFSLNAPIEFPNVLVETAFISNPEEEMLLINPDFQYKIAHQIVEGLKEFYLNYGYLETVSDMPDK
jgi:N-acetylmuramoyl-L-alanine amidase